MLKKLQFNITHKILLLVGILSALAALTTLYSLNNLHTVSKNYRALLDSKTQNTLIIGEALLSLSDASRLAFSVLTEQEEKQMRVSQNTLMDQQLVFIKQLEQIRDLTAAQKIALSHITTQQAHVFGLINDVIEQASRWRGDRALIIIHQQLEPEFKSLRSEMDQLRESILNDYLSTSEQLSATSKDTITHTSLALAIILLLAIIFTSLVSYINISRPITRLTRVMSRLSDRQYDDPIAYQQRYDEVGRMAQALHIFRDSMQRADRLELEAARSKENKRLSQQIVALTDAMPGAVFQLRLNADGSQQFLFLSSKAERFLGRSTEYLLEHIFAKNEPVFPASSAFKWIINKAFNESRKTLKPIDTDIRVKLESGTFWYKILATCQPTEGYATLFNGILLDVSASKMQAQALEEAKNSAEQAARAKAIFLTTMSHEIRTPMNAILGLTQLMHKHDLSPDQQARLAKISTAGAHLLSIINDILDFSKIDGNHLKLENTAFEPAAVLANTVELLNDEAQNKGLTLHTEIDPQLPQYLMGDPTRIGQILLNYLHNAIKFSESGAIYVRVRLNRHNPADLQLYYEVQDQGIGIAKDHQSSLFQEFNQADTSITRRFGGTGLGLAISSKLARLMAGDVGVNSVEGQGSTFWFTAAVTVPAAQALINEPTLATLPSAPPLLFNGLRVLLVDDNELNRLVGQEILESAGFIVDLAYDGQQAVDCLQQAQAQYYSAILMDIMMPVLDGISATEKIRRLATGKTIPIIAVSANVSADDQQRYTAAGMSAYISKPIDEQQLWHTLERCLQHTTSTTLSNTTTHSVIESEPAAGDFNQQHLQSLHSSMGDQRFAELLNKLMIDYQMRLDSVEHWNASQHTALIQQNLHDLISTAGHAGFHQLSKQALQLNNALYNNETQLIAELKQQIEHTLKFTLNYLADLLSTVQAQ